MLRMRNVSKVYHNGTVALTSINLTVDKGEMVFIVGQSGAGKSTLFKLINRKELPTTGEVWVGRKSVPDLKKSEIPIFRRNVGMIYQDFKLLPNKTTFDNIAFALEVIEASRREILRQVPAVLELVGLRDKGKAYPHELSGGEQQRVSLARAIVNRPIVLMADEPTGNLDPETSWGIMDLLVEINRRGTTVLMATHNKDIVNRMRRRVIALEDGKIIRDEQRGAYDIES
ncbi:MAG: cell division ATP-binding protein FtsE [Bacillota bacterium]